MCDFVYPQMAFFTESMIKQPKTTSNFGVPSSILGDPIPLLIFDQVSSSPNTSQFHDPFMIIPRVFYLCKDNRKVICNHSIPQVYCWVDVHTGFPFISIYDIIFIELWSFPICHFHASFMTNWRRPLQTKSICSAAMSTFWVMKVFISSTVSSRCLVVPTTCWSKK